MYRFTPVDCYFFRSAVPYELAGETSLIDTVFPPYPWIYAGALKDYKTQKRFRIGFNGITINDKICFPKPLDLLYDNCKSMSISKPPLSNYPLEYCLIDDSSDKGKVKIQDDLYADYCSMKKYLANKSDKINYYNLSDYLISEPKIGIKLDKKEHIVMDEHLYQIKMIRPKDELKLVAEISNINIEEDTVIKFGGESKTAKVNSFDYDLSIGVTESESSYFKIYLATPAMFNNGWLPKWIDPKNMCGSFSYKNKRVRVKLITAAIGRKVAVGGFNSEQNENPNEMRYAVPAGSVYYFKLIEGTFKNAVYLFNQRCISDYRMYKTDAKFDKTYNRYIYCDRGFGYAIVGALNKEQEEFLECIQKKI